MRERDYGRCGRVGEYGQSAKKGNRRVGKGNLCIRCAHMAVEHVLRARFVQDSIQSRLCLPRPPPRSPPLLRKEFKHTDRRDFGPGTRRPGCRTAHKSATPDFSSCCGDSETRHSRCEDVCRVIECRGQRGSRENVHETAARVHTSVASQFSNTWSGESSGVKLVEGAILSDSTEGIQAEHLHAPSLTPRSISVGWA